MTDAINIDSQPGPSGQAGACPDCGCPEDDTWFDRSLCQCDGTDWGVMHTRCAGCGRAVDRCGFEEHADG